MFIVRQFPIKLFVRLYPEYPIPTFIDRNDEKYVVRFDDATEPFTVEVGYPDDDWTLTIDS